MAERDYWATNLQPAKFAGVEFPIASRVLSGGRSWAKHRFAFRDGQDDEDTGREPYVFEVEIPLFRSIDASHYPEKFEALRFAFDDPDTKGRGEWVDPELGPLTVKIDKWTWSTDPMMRNGGVFKVRVEEVGDDAFVFTTQTGDFGSDPEDVADLADAEINALGVTKADAMAKLDAEGVSMPDVSLVEEGAVLAAVATAALDVIEGGVVDAVELTAAVDTAMRRIDAIANLDAVTGVDGAEALGLLAELGNAIAGAAERVAGSVTPIAELALEGTTSSVELALRLYGDATRAAEIEARNPVFCALFLPAGMVVAVAST